MASLTDSSWEEVGKQARHPENDIDVKLVAFNKLGISGSRSSLNSESESLNNSDDDETSETLSMALHQLLNKISTINDKMADWTPTGTATLHTPKRQREIRMMVKSMMINDYQEEFRKTLTRANARRKQEELLRDGSPPPATAAGLIRRGQNTKEANHLDSSDILVDEQRNVAMEAREHLTSQRQAFKWMQTRFNDITNRFPMLNSLIYRINTRKRRDSLILGLVVVVCTFLLLFYAFS